MSTSYYDYSIDPVTNTIYPITLRSLSKGGTTDYKIGVADVTVPSAANFPSTNTTSTPSRYFIELPMDVYYTSTNATAFSVTNETQSRNLTVVDPTASLTNYTCKFMSQGAEKKSILEAHVGSTSNQAGDSLSYEGLFAGTAWKSTNLDNLFVDDLTILSTAKVPNINVSSVLQIGGGNTTAITGTGISLSSTAIGPYLSIQNTGVNSTLSTNEVLRIKDAGAGGLGGIAMFAYSERVEPLRIQAEVAAGVAGTEGVLIESKVGGSGHTGNYLSVKNGGSYLLRVQGNGNVTVNNFLIASAGVVTRLYSSAAFNPTNANLQTALGASTAKTSGWVGVVGSTNSTYYVVTTDGSTWYFYATMTRAT